MRNKLRSKRSAVRTAIATAAIVAVSLFAVAPAHAETLPPSPEVEGSAVAAEGTPLTPAQEAELTALVDAADLENQIFDVAAATEAGVSESQIADFSYVVAANGWEIVGAQDVDQLLSSASSSLVTSYSGCTGANGYTGYWGWGWQWAANSCITDSLIAGAAAGAGGVGAIAAILTAIPPAAAAAPIAYAAGAVVAAGGGFLAACKTFSYGVHAIYLNINSAGAPGCWGQ